MTLHELLADPATPYWARDVIRLIDRRDQVDVVKILESLIDHDGGPMPASLLRMWHSHAYSCWARDVIRLVLDRDPVDAVNVLETILQALEERSLMVAP